MNIPYYHIDSFANQLFEGNPAGVCLLDAWPADATLQHIASENNLPETAFLVPQGENHEIRWFSTQMEIDLCGHATLAAGYVLLNRTRTATGIARFFSPRSGELTVTRKNDLLVLDFPTQSPVPCPAPPELAAALGKSPIAVLKSQDYLAVYDDEDEISAMTPNFDLLKRLGLRGVIVTAKGKKADFVSRFFAPKIGIDEDPVTGSAHCALVPYWKNVLNKTTFHAVQLSTRGGELFCEDQGNRVLIAGRAFCYLHGTITIENFD